MKIKISKLIFLSLFIACGISVSKAQDDYAAPPPPPPPPPVKSSGNKKAETIKAAKYFFIFQIDARSKITLSIQEDEYFDDIETVSKIDTLARFFDDLKNTSVEKPNSPKTKIDPFVIVKADENLSLEALAAVLQKAREFTGNEVRIHIARERIYPNIFVQSKSNSVGEAKPNPLFLLVEMKPDKKVTLNKESVGDTDDLSKLVNILVKIFKDRENNGVFREGTNEVEKTVVVKAPPSMKYADVLKIFTALRDAGTSPIRLQIDDLR